MKIPFIGDKNAQIQQRIQEAAFREFCAAAKDAMVFESAGPDPAGTGDFIMVGHSKSGLQRVAIRFSVVQTMMVCSQVCATLATAMNQEAKQTAAIVGKDGKES